MALRPGLRAGALAAVAATVMICGFAAAPPLRHGEGAERHAAVHPAHANPAVVGALFTGGLSGGHFCTASVVVSPGRDLLITAAHCIYDGNTGGYAKNVVFVPGYHGGKAPYGIWTASRLLVAPQWQKSADPDYDVGFIVLQSLHGREIQQVVGGNGMGTDTGYRYRVRVTGYPDATSEPVSCVNWTTGESATQLQFDCGGFTDGTSGGPFVTQSGAPSPTSTVVGVIGGYQQGGDTPSVSYSALFGAGSHQLYQQAAALSQRAEGTADG
jgi:V8-like Glu-specific endopeptidase